MCSPTTRSAESIVDKNSRRHSCPYGILEVSRKAVGIPACAVLDEVIIATCDQEIVDAAHAFGAKAVKTSASHERAPDRVAEAVKTDNAEIVVMVQGDEPMIRPEMISSALEPMLRDHAVKCVNLAAPIKIEQELNEKNTIKVVVSRIGTALYFSREPTPTMHSTPFKVDEWFKQVCVIPFRKQALEKFSPLPEEIVLAQAAHAEPLAVVLEGLRRLGAAGQLDRPKRCAVIGADTIGQLAARVLTHRGYDVTVFDRQPERFKHFDAPVSTSTSLTQLGRFDWLVEATEKQEVLSALLQNMAIGATALLLGLPYDNQKFNFESIGSYDRSIIGTAGSSGAGFIETLGTLLMIDTSQFLNVSFPLHEYESCWKAARHPSNLKIMIAIQSTDN